METHLIYKHPSKLDFQIRNICEFMVFDSLRKWLCLPAYLWSDRILSQVAWSRFFFIQTRVKGWLPLISVRHSTNVLFTVLLHTTSWINGPARLIRQRLGLRSLLSFVIKFLIAVLSVPCRMAITSGELLSSIGIDSASWFLKFWHLWSFLNSFATL